ncbi:hypothetical protein PJWF_00070 [Achromobacter phage JWF]|uniref:hypothetical protein n=1 Tax=Achromobacter phage JWF TaxID=1589748 RepID=UPI000588E7B7|nr:hypothetical protein AXJ13_gp118 [Achromobacter phage JWF]AJD82963.1 hypothetical protein PJWF_00070 [Achromobacter phage JWF]
MRSGEHLQTRAVQMDQYGPAVRVTGWVKLPTSVIKDKEARLNFLFLGVSHSGKPFPGIQERLAALGYTAPTAPPVLYNTPHEIPQAEVEHIQNIKAVDDALFDFSQDPTGDAGFNLVRAIMFALKGNPDETSEQV